MIDAYIPIADHQVVEIEIIDALNSHPLINQIIINSTSEFYPRGDKRRYKAIAKNRLKIFGKAIEKGNPFFLMCNSNRMMPFIPHINEIYQYMLDNSHCGFAAYNPLKTKRSPRHVAIGFGIVRTEAAKIVNFNMDKIGSCDCIALVDEMRRSQWAVSYVGPNILIKKHSQ